MVIVFELFLPFLRYCTEILALLPFTTLDEPLYLVYAINRVLQVRAGTLEANMKSFLHLLQGGMTVPGNVSIPDKASGQPFQDDIASTDVKMTVEENCAKNSDSDLHSLILGSCGISEENLQKIQVECFSVKSVTLIV